MVATAAKEMFAIVVASAKGGRKNGSSLSVLRGTMPGRFCTSLSLSWILHQVAAKNCSSLPVLRGTMLAKKNIRDCRGFCKRWQQKWFVSVGCSWDYAGEIMNWLGFVVDSVTGGSKNCFSLAVLRGTMLAKKKRSRLSWLL